MKGTKFRFVCVMCALDGVETEAVFAIDNQSLCHRHAHPCYQTPRPKLTVIKGGLAS